MLEIKLPSRWLPNLSCRCAPSSITLWQYNMASQWGGAAGSQIKKKREKETQFNNQWAFAKLFSIAASNEIPYCGALRIRLSRSTWQWAPCHCYCWCCCCAQWVHSVRGRWVCRYHCLSPRIRSCVQLSQNQFPALWQHRSYSYVYPPINPSVNNQSINQSINIYIHLRV